MGKVRFCVEEFEENNQYSLKRHYNLERLEKVLGKNFWYREEKLRKLLKEFIEFPYIENMIELLKVTPHAPVYDKNELKDFQPNVLLITNEPGLNYDVIKNLYLKPLRTLVEGSYKNFGCIFEYQIALKELIEKMIQRFNRSMFSWLTLTPLRELGDKINGDSVKQIRNDCRVLQNIASHNDQDDLKKIAYCLKKISYWIPTHESILEQLKKKRESLNQLSRRQSSPPQELLDELGSLIENLQRLQQQQSLLQSLEESIERLLELLQQQSSRLEESQQSRGLRKEIQQLKQLLQQLKQQLKQSGAIFMVNMWLNFIKQEGPRVIHWDLLPYAQNSQEDENDINDEIREIIEEVEQKNFQNIRNNIISKASHKQSLWYVKLLDKFLEAFKEVNVEEGRFFILVVGNRIIKKYGSDNEEKDRREILGHLFAGLCEAKKEDIEKLREAIVIFRDRWCSCSKPKDYPANLYFVKFDDFLDNNGNFSWTKFNDVFNANNRNIKGIIYLDNSTFYGGKNKIPCY